MSVTDLLDILGLLALATGVTGGAWTYIGAWALCLGAVVLFAGSYLAGRGAES